MDNSNAGVVVVVISARDVGTVERDTVVIVW